jgi:hypothetical protein
VDDADAHPAGVNFLAHYFALAFFFAGVFFAVAVLAAGLRFGFGASSVAVSAAGGGGAVTAASGRSVRRTVM